MGTANLLEAIREDLPVCARSSVSPAISTMKTAKPASPYRESDPLGGHDPYSSSKACAEIVASACRDSFFPPARFKDHRVLIATGRPGNVIGGSDWSERPPRSRPPPWFPFLAGPCLSAAPKPFARGNMCSSLLHGYILLAEQLLSGCTAASSAFNFGPRVDDMWAVERIGTKLVDMWGPGAS